MPTPYPSRGTSKAYILERLRLEGLHQLVAAIEAGRITATGTAIELGWIARPPNMGLRPNHGRRRRLVVGQLRREGAFGANPELACLPDAAAVAPMEPVTNSAAELMELTIGPGAMGSYFRTRDELRAGWEAAREELPQRSQPGRRPQAWWEFDAPFPYPGLDFERSTLWRAGLLSADEKHQLEVEWRAEFERAWEPGFVEYEACRMVKGARARRLYFAWADIPHELVEQWTGERRRARPRSRIDAAG
jgi:hypothetical protein